MAPVKCSCTTAHRLITEDAPSGLDTSKVRTKLHGMDLIGSVAASYTSLEIDQKITLWQHNLHNVTV